MVTEHLCTTGETRDVAIAILFLYVDHYHEKSSNIGLNPNMFVDAVLQYIQEKDVHSKVM